MLPIHWLYYFGKVWMIKQLVGKLSFFNHSNFHWIFHLFPFHFPITVQQSSHYFDFILWKIYWDVRYIQSYKVDRSCKSRYQNLGNFTSRILRSVNRVVWDFMDCTETHQKELKPSTTSSGFLFCPPCPPPPLHPFPPITYFFSFHLAWPLGQAESWYWCVCLSACICLCLCVSVCPPPHMVLDQAKKPKIKKSGQNLVHCCYLVY